MLFMHILLKNAGHAGFITKCSRRIRNSVNRVLMKTDDQISVLTRAFSYININKNMYK